MARAAVTSGLLHPGCAPALGGDELAAEDGAGTLRVALLAGILHAVRAICSCVLAIGGLRGVHLVAERARRRVGFGDLVDGLGGAAHERVRERSGGEAGGGDADETPAAGTGDFCGHRELLGLAIDVRGAYRFAWGLSILRIAQARWRSQRPPLVLSSPWGWRCKIQP